MERTYSKSIALLKLSFVTHKWLIRMYNSLVIAYLNAWTRHQLKKFSRNVMSFKALQTELPENISVILKFKHNDIHQLRDNDRKLYLGKPNPNFF